VKNLHVASILQRKNKALMKKSEVPEKGLLHKKDVNKVRVRKEHKNKISRILISPTHINLKIKSLAKQIVIDSKKNNINKLEIVVVLKGASMFANVLVGEIFKCGGPSLRVNYVEASSYKGEAVTSGKVSITGNLEYLKNKYVIVVEDIIDTGLTIFKLKKYLLTKCKAKKVKICTLLNKESRRLEKLKGKIQIEYKGFDIPDLFIVGFGMDYEDEFREFPYIAVVKEEYYLEKK